MKIFTQRSAKSELGSDNKPCLNLSLIYIVQHAPLRRNNVTFNSGFANDVASKHQRFSCMSSWPVEERLLRPPSLILCNISWGLCNFLLLVKIRGFDLDLKTIFAQLNEILLFSIKMSNNILKLLKSASVKGPLIIFNKLISKALLQDRLLANTGHIIPVLMLSWVWI